MHMYVWGSVFPLLACEVVFLSLLSSNSVWRSEVLCAGRHSSGLRILLCVWRCVCVRVSVHVVYLNTEGYSKGLIAAAQSANYPLLSEKEPDLSITFVFLTLSHILYHPGCFVFHNGVVISPFSFQTSFFLHCHMSACIFKSFSLLLQLPFSLSTPLLPSLLTQTCSSLTPPLSVWLYSTFDTPVYLCSESHNPVNQSEVI